MSLTLASLLLYMALGVASYYPTPIVVVVKQVSLTNAINGKVMRQMNVYKHFSTFASMMVEVTYWHPACEFGKLHNIRFAIEVKDQEYKRIIVSPTYASAKPSMRGEELHINADDLLCGYCLWEQIDTNPQFCIQCVLVQSMH